MKRKSKLTPLKFIDLMFFALSGAYTSLEKITTEAQIEHSLPLSKQGLDSRFSDASVSFSKALLADAVCHPFDGELSENEQHLFKRVLIKDSTRFHVDEALQEHFPSTGGDAPKAGVSIQFEYDLKNGAVSDIDLQAVLDRDSNDALEKLALIQPGDLIIRDLGYYHGAVLKHIDENDAFYISRLHASSHVYADTQGKEKIDFGSIYREMNSNKEQKRDISIYIGKARIPSRLIIVLMPDEVYEKRIRERKRINKYTPKSKSRSKNKEKQAEWDAQREGTKGYNLSDEFKSKAHFNLFICNITQEDLPASSICNLYRVRWQIELMFKVWKSIMHIHCIQKMKYTRLVTLIYMSLLWIILHWKIIYFYRSYIYAQEKRMKHFQMYEHNAIS